jgi:hemoglobin-like flavoprotein
MSNGLMLEVWDQLAGGRVELVRAFYDRLFEEYPEYKEMFPENMDHQMEKMVEMVGAVVRFADNIDLIRTYLQQVGVAHRSFHIHEKDLNNFKRVFIETVADACKGFWRDEHEEAFRHAFDDVIIPIVDEGLEA